MSATPKFNNRYEIKEIVGEGGMGIVYRAVDRELKRDVALKTIKELLDSQQMELFLRECDVLKKLEHPNIINLYDAGISEEGGEQKPFLVMPFLPGSTLDRLIRSHAARLTPDRVVDIITQTARGLQAAHDMGLIHRDVKPSNIFVLSDDSVKLIDFGVVHLADQHSRTGFKGTLPYMSPEQWDANPPTAVSDVFSLAVVCYEALARRRPFTGSTETEIREAILNLIPPPIAELNPAVSLAVSQVIHAAMAKQPWNRTSSARQFAEELQKALHGQPIDRFDPSRIEPRIARVQRALESSEYDFAAEIISEIEAEGHIHPTVRSLRKQINQALRERTIKQSLESARHRLGEGEYQLALQKVDQVLRLDATNAAALALKNEIDSSHKTQQIENWFSHAQDHLKNYSFNHARQALQNVLRLKPTNNTALQMIAEVDRRENEYLREHREKEQLYKDALDAWHRGEVSVAFGRLERVLELDRRAPDNASSESAVSYQNLYEQVRSEHGRINNTYQEARKLLGENEFTGASSLCEQILTKYPEHTLFQALKEDIGERQRQHVSSYIIKIDRDVEAEPDLDRKVAILAEAQRLYPDETHFKERLDKASRRRDLVGAIKQKVDNLEERGQYVEALGQLEILRAIYPQYPGMDLEVDRIKRRRDQQVKADEKTRWVNQIDTALTGGDFSHALNLLKSALADFPDDAELLAQERLARAGDDRAHEASRVFESAQASCAEGDLKTGLQELWHAFELDNRNPLIQAVLVETLLKRASAELDTDGKLSEQLVTKAIELDPGNRQAVNLQRLILDRQKEKAVDLILSRSREVQASGDAPSALTVVQEGLGAYPDERRLLARQEALLKILPSTRRPEVQEAREADLKELHQSEDRLKNVQDAETAHAILDRSNAIAGKYPADVEVQSIRRSVEDLFAVQAATDWGHSTTANKPVEKPKPVSEKIQPPKPEEPILAAATDVVTQTTETVGAVGGAPARRGTTYAVVAAIVLIAIAGIAYRASRARSVEPALPPVEAELSIDASVAGAHIIIDGKDVGTAPLTWKFGEGAHTLDAVLAGYGSKPIDVRVERGAPPPSNTTVTLEALPTVLRVSTEFQQASLDNEKLMLDGTGFEKPDLSNGPHILQLSSPIGGMITVEFETGAGRVPIVRKVESAQTPVVAVASLNDRGELYSSSKTLKIGLNGAEGQPIADQGLPATLVPDRNVLVLDDSKAPVTVTVKVDPNPGLTIFVGAQPNVGNLEITETGKVDGTVVVEPADKKGQARTQSMKSGKTTFFRLEPKAYQVEVSAPGFESTKISVAVVKGDVVKAPAVSLKPLTTVATLVIAGGTPDADVFVDNNPVGKVGANGAFNYQTTPGRHRIQLRKADFDESPTLDVDLQPGGTSRLSASDGVALKPYGWIEFNVNPPNSTITYRSANGNGGPPVTLKNGDAPRVRAGRYMITVSANGYQPQIEQAFDVEAGKGKPFNRTLVASNGTKDVPAPVRTIVLIGKEGLEAPQPQVPFSLFRQQTQGTYSFKIKLRRTFPIGKRAKWVVNFVDTKNYIEYELDDKTLKYTTHQNGREQSKSIQHRMPATAGDVYDFSITVATNEIAIASGGQPLPLDTPQGFGNLLAGKFGFPKDENVDLESFRFTGPLNK